VEEPRLERAVTVGVLVVAGLLGTALVTLGSESTGPPSIEVATRAAELAPSSTTQGVPVPTTTVPVPTTPDAAAATVVTAAPTTTVPTDDPGALPQTDDRPSAAGARFDAGVQGLWQAIRDDQPERAMPFFFPKTAYLQVKAISDPATDYEQRLIANYEQDIHALHAQLGADAANAQFAAIDVPDSQAVVVQPGEEYNTLSYWRVYGTTLQYTEDGQTNSFPVTSLISWRGEWYVVHLGAIR
jgi:hypothetical protein